jgi:DNA-binding response OmpR family regulator
MTKVLLAEDDSSMLYLLKTLLGMEGYEVSVLDVQGDFVAGVRAEDPDVLLMDVHLAGKSGMAILEELRGQEDLKDTAIIMSSGMNLERESREAGATAFLLKPYMPEELISLIRQHTPEGQG